MDNFLKRKCKRCGAKFGDDERSFSFSKDEVICTPCKWGVGADFVLELESKLDELFPKGKSKERGKALVLFAEAVRLHKKALKEAYSQGFDDGFVHDPLSKGEWDKLKFFLTSKK